MPEPVSQLERAESAFLTPDLVVMVEVRNVRKLLAQAQWRILSIHADRGLEGPEVPREVEMLVLREKLIGENQDRILGEGFFDCLEVGRGDLFRQVDIADFSSEAGRDRIDGYGHDHALRARDVAPIRGIGSRWTNACDRDHLGWMRGSMGWTPTSEGERPWLIPNPIDQNPWAHWRSPMDMMRQG